MRPRNPGPRPQESPLVCGVCAAATFMGHGVIHPLGREPGPLRAPTFRVQRLDPESSEAEPMERPAGGDVR